MGQIFSAIVAGIAVIRELIKLAYMFFDLVADQKAKEAAEREAKLREAVDKQKNAQTEKDFDDAQNDISDSVN
jgi:hypothetical protein